MGHRPLATTARAAIALAAGMTIAACIIHQDPPPPVYQQPGGEGADHGRPQHHAGGGQGWLADGDYACSIESGGYSYPPFRCVVYSGEGGQLLEKMGGSQRFRGRVLPDGEGFRFDGTFFCPWGDCTEDVSGTFQPAGHGWYRGTIQGDSMHTSPLVVTLQYTPGGFTYGGAGYGGAAYGGHQHGPYSSPPGR
jgi:hypothetical protein